MNRRWWMVAAALGGAALGSRAAAEQSALVRPAVPTASAARAVLQGAALAGERVVAVGERGIVVVSDDAGQRWRQVSVPVSVGLNAVRFVDAQRGWIVGHGGVVLASTDGGLSWTRQLDGLRAGTAAPAASAAAGLVEGADRPLLDLHFQDARQGLVVGAYNLALATQDGGRSWQSIAERLDNPRGLHLYALRARGDELLIAGEQGLVLHSTDRGRTFKRLTLPYAGSFFTAELPGSQAMLVAGLRGQVWRSVDGGVQWQQLAVPVPAAITASALDAKGQPWLANQAGMVLRLDGDKLTPLPAKLPPLTGLLPLPRHLSGQAGLALSLAGAWPVTLGSSK